MEQEKRVIAAFALSFAILMVWRAFFFKAPPAQTTKVAPAISTARMPSGEPTGSTPSAHPGVTTLPVEEGSTAQEVVIESDLYRVTFSTEGAVIQSWVLKKYRDKYERPLDVVRREACEKLGYPMSIRLADPDSTTRLNQATFVVKPAGRLVNAPATLEFSYSDGKIQVRKEFSFGTGYDLNVKVRAYDGQKYLPVEVAWPGGFGDQTLDQKYLDTLGRAVYGTADHLTTVVQAKVKEDQVVSSSQLAGMEDRFFASIYFPESPDATFRISRQTWTPSDWKEKELPRPLLTALGTPLQEPLAFRWFLGPKDLDVLRAQKPSLDGLVDFGWFGAIAKPLLVALRFIYDHWIHNWGWAIVILTILINIAMFPLKLRSIRSAQQMQRVAPIVKGIQDRYKHLKFNDPRKQRMNEEMMKVYKEHNINPLGGCLPMALQLPFLYGFWRVLDQAIELRHAPWIGWVKDLSASDPYYVLPGLMVITMFVLQRMTPIATTDPTQQRMMMIMPLAFGFMFFSFASGLVLYYLMANVVGIAQQVAINRMHTGQPKTQPPAVSSSSSAPPRRVATARH